MIATDTDAALRRMLEEGRARAAQVDQHHALLWEALEAATEGGKRFRPMLVVATHDALGGSHSQAAAEVGAAIELLHTALVIHDDVIDGDHVRRGQPNVSGRFQSYARAVSATPDDAAGYGLTAAVLAGDLALAAAVRAIATCEAPRNVAHRLLDLLDTALHTTAAGELADVRLSMRTDEVSLADSLDMEERKTSAYSFALPLQAGAVLAGASSSITERLEVAGRMTGVAFQLVDDLVGVFGDPARSGKSTTSDLRTGKRTPLLVHARSTPEWSLIAGYVGRNLTAEELTEVRSLLEAAGSRRFVEDLADQRLADARAALTDVGLPITLLEGVSTRPPALADGGGEAA